MAKKNTENLSADDQIDLDEALEEIGNLQVQLSEANAEIVALREQLKPAVRAKGSSIGPVPVTDNDDLFVIPMNDPFFAGAMRTFQKLGGAGDGPSTVQRPLGLILDAGDPLTEPVLKDYLGRCRSADPKRAKEVAAVLERFGKSKK